MTSKSVTSYLLHSLLLACVVVMAAACPVIFLADGIQPAFLIIELEENIDSETSGFDADFLTTFTIIAQSDVSAHPICSWCVDDVSMDTESILASAHSQRGPPLL